MKILMRPIDVIALFSSTGKLTPIRFRVPAKDNEEATTISVNQIQVIQEEKLAGNRMTIFRCQSVINGTERIYELKHESDTCKWFLYKM